MTTHSFIPSASWEPYGLSAQVAAEVPSLKGMGEEQLWQYWHSKRDPAARKLLSELYLPYARAMAAKSYSRRVHSEFQFEEYFHFAVVGMMESLDRYLPQRGAQFKTFATPRINGAILNGLDGLSERQQQIGFRRRLERERLESLKTEDAAQDHGQKLLQQLSDIGVGVALGFLLEGTGMLIDVDDRLPDNAYSHVELRQLRERIWRLVEQLTEREAEVIRRHYLQQQGFDEIASALELTKGRISQLHSRGLERIRKLIEATNSCDVAW